jgi:RNA recognition motif-containing protein
MREGRDKHMRKEHQMSRSKYEEDQERILSTRLYVGNLEYNTTLSQFRETFGKFGEIIKIDLKKGYAFVVRKPHKYFLNLLNIGVRKKRNSKKS